MPSYDLNTESINSFVEDNQIKLPRFQRKLTWSDEDNFKLCLSVFKGYPLGVIVLTTEGENKYLLDGRQRRNALAEMRNPENIYDWAKSAIGFNVKDSESSVRSQYWKFVDRYFGTEEYDEYENKNKDAPARETDQDPVSEEDDGGTNIDNGSGTDEDQLDSDNAEEEIEDKNILKLRDIILTVHEKRGKKSEFTEPFDFRNEIDNLDYIKTGSSNRRYVSTEDLINWIEYKSEGDSTPNINEFCQDDFYNWLMYNRVAGESGNAQEDAIRRKIERNWNQIIDSLSALEDLNTTLANRKLGYLAVRDVTANDEKKIFEIINSEGTDLSSVEILSAKPSYNIEINNPSEKLVNDIQQLYRDEMGVEQQDAVRWDRPATFYMRLNIPTVFPSESYSFERRVRIGFKLMSGYYLKGISKDDFEDLSYEEIVWGSTDLEDKINRLESMITDHALLRFWADWGDPLIRKSSEAVAVNYVLCLLYCWEDMGKPTSVQTAAYNAFKNKSAILFDKMIYEYVTRLWRGSSDSKVANNLSNFDSDSSLFNPVSQGNWESVINDLFNDGIIEGQSQLQNKSPTNEVKLLLRYYYVLKNERPSRIGKMSVDHIIPQAQIESSTNEDLQKLTHHIANLAELPSDDNRKKGDKKLTEISDPWLKSQIEVWTGIEEESFSDYDDPSDLEKLILERGQEMKAEFLEARKSMLPI